MFEFSFPEDFLLGTANSAFQCEGAWDRDGKSMNVIDFYSRKYAGKPHPTTGKILTEFSPDDGCFFYDNYEAYIEDMQKTGQNVYRLSLAWPRILPDGLGEVNPKGIAFYNKVIDKLLSCGITPFVDLYHWDLPQCLQEQGGFLNPAFPQWFEAYAKVCFEAFGDRVKMWSTFNEPDVFVMGGYQRKSFPPFRDGAHFTENRMRDSQLAAHHCILAHFRAVRLFRAMGLNGKIGSVNCLTSISAADMVEEDFTAVKLQYAFRFEWWVQPMLEGTYPQEPMRLCPEAVLGNMPEHFRRDLDEWFEPMDFVGVNYYVASRTRYDPERTLKCTPAESFYSAPGQLFAPYPAGLFDVVQYISLRFHNVEIYITENGCALPNRHDEELECDDPERITYLREHLRMCARLIDAGYNLKGYYYWNDADSYEELDGYNLRFGLTWVDHETGRRRWKKSRHYFSRICKTRMID
jgi:beta-glucosidase